MSSTIEYLEEERKKLWAKILNLEEEIVKKTSDYEDDAKKASKKTSEYRNRAEEAKELTLKYQEEASRKLDEIQTSHKILYDEHIKITELYENSKVDITNIKSEYTELVNRKAEIENYVEQLEELFNGSTDLSDKIKKVEEAFNSVSDYTSKINVANKSVLERKKEIDELYYEIMGYKDEDEQGNETEIKGLKSELENSYTEIKSNLSETTILITKIEEENTKKYKEFTEQKDIDYKTTMERWEREYAATHNKIQSLLPNALTAGLSHAYSKKKEDEVAESVRLSRRFTQAIWGMVCVSLIPFTISIIQLLNGKLLKEVLLDMPRFVLSILPLYIPVLWVAYSANRKLNLSKRLIEEYTHKEVLSKTYEGLSHQINELDDKSISADLRNQLLYTILEVSSENPGKLISDYNKSDHPIMDALEKSAKLGSTVDKLSKFPGLLRLTALLEKRSTAIIEEQNNLANKGIQEIETEKHTS